MVHGLKCWYLQAVTANGDNLKWEIVPSQRGTIMGNASGGRPAVKDVTVLLRYLQIRRGED